MKIGFVSISPGGGNAKIWTIEEAVNVLLSGSLLREYGLILHKEIFSSNANLFEGKENRKLPIYIINGILTNLYYLAKKMVAYLLSLAFYRYCIQRY